MIDFVHLHNHSEYSLLDGIARCRDIASRCVELGYDAYALTDHGVMYGAIEFYQAMRAADLKPIIGCEFYVAARNLEDKDPQLDRRSRHLVLLAKDRTGYQNLMKLTSIAHTEGFYYKPRVDTKAIMQHKEGLVALTACPGGVVGGAFNHESADRALEELDRYLRIFGDDNLFLEIQNHGLDIERNFIEWASRTAREKGVRLVATNDCHYVNSGDARAHDIALCLRDKKLLTDTDRMKYSGPDYYIKSKEEMAALFPDLPEALANTRTVAEMCNLELELDQVHFPQFTIAASEKAELKTWVEQNPTLIAQPGTNGDNEAGPADPEVAAGAVEAIIGPKDTPATYEAFLRMLTYRGAQHRYGELSQSLIDRIEYELSVIIPKGFTTYFLICAEFCRWARSKGIPVGPGRGSAAGSVVAYCLEITDLEPIKHGLYFERFLNPERIELPDFDIDFCMRRRDEVIEHVKELYGADRVALIITYSRLKARAVIKAVARTKGLEFQYVNRVTNEIPVQNSTIAEALEQSEELRKLVNSDETIAELIEDAKRLEGIAAYSSVHAAGLVIAPSELPNFVPVQKHKDSDLLVTQYAMDTVPKTGLVKFDFLGLRNLTMIQDTVDFVNRLEGADLDARAFPENDPETFSTLRRGDAYGVFQFEAPQVKRMLIEGHPENVGDLAAINAANRPGPISSGNTELYLKNRKAGVAGVSQYGSIADLLQPTGGVLLFQEQVLEVARKLADYTLGEADVLRKAMGKKKLEIMEEQKKKFIAGAAKHGVSLGEINQIWDMMEKFAGYGFNKAHSTCYSWISYQTAFLKTHYPHYYMAAMLNNYMGNSDKLAQILAQCRKMHIPVLPPSVNDGDADFMPTKNGEIIFGLCGIKGLGAAAVDSILAQRRLGRPYHSLTGFLQRTRGKGVNRKVLQSLAMAGAFDCLEPDRKELIRNLDDLEAFMRGGGKQVKLFGEVAEESEPGALPTNEVTDFDVALLEKQAIGLFLTHHPFEDHPIYSDRRYLQLSQLQDAVIHNPMHWNDRPLPNNGLAGLLTNITVRTASTSGKSYAKGRLEDPERSLEVIIWPRTYENAKELIQENTPVVVRGRMQLPESVEQPEDAWDELEVVVESVEAYTPNGNPSDEFAGIQENSIDRGGNGVKHSPRETNQMQTTRVQKSHKDSFSPLPIKWEIDLQRTNIEQLNTLAGTLENCEGEHEVRMRLREVSGQLKRIKVNQRFYASKDIAEQLEREFPFITPLG